MRVVCIVQDRIGNSRLPGKSLLDLAGEPMSARILERITRARRLDEIVHALPASQENDVLERIGLRAGVVAYRYRGDENDLFARYLEIAECYHADIIVRISADNPCIDPAVIDETVEAYVARPCLFLSSHDYYKVDWQQGTYVIVDGVGCEVFSYNRLQWLSEYAARHGLDREQPQRAAQNAGLVTRLPGHGVYADRLVSLDIDYETDYPMLRDLYGALYVMKPRFTVSDVLTYLDTRHAQSPVAG